MRKIIKQSAARVRITDKVSGHSLRIGSAVALTQGGASLVDIQVAGRWKYPGMPHTMPAPSSLRGGNCEVQRWEIAIVRKILSRIVYNSHCKIPPIAPDCAFDRTDVLYNSIKNTDDKTLITELQRRGYNLDSQIEKKTTAEIVKIG